MKPSVKSTHQKIHKWYRTHGRTDLPWRTTDDPYHIYLSEVMLQQTQVKTVLERYYFPFLEAFPTLEDLGNAPLDDVMKRWEGLGYYNRAKNLHRTAQILTERQAQGIAPTIIPSEIDTLMDLPGIGKNTAHALAAFAFKKPVPVMEANVKRILCRLHRLRTPDEKRLWKLAYDMLDEEQPFDYNQAMMDIGATLCLPRNPKCGLCPLEDVCRGKETPERYPLKQKKKVPTREENILIPLYDDRLSLQQRHGKFLHGLWGFESVGVPPCAAEYIGEVSHAYTHFKLKCRVYLYHESRPEQAHYFTPEAIEKLAVSKVDEKILKLYLGTI